MFSKCRDQFSAYMNTKIFTVCCTLCAMVAMSKNSSAQSISIVGRGSDYDDSFGESVRFHVDPDDSHDGLKISVKSVKKKNKSWDLSASGGLSVKKSKDKSFKAGASISFEGNAMRFGVEGNSRDLRSAMGDGHFISSWAGSLRLDLPGRVVEARPNTIYQVSFDIAGANGLLDPSMDIFPRLTFSLTSKGGKRIETIGGDSVVNLLTILGQDQTSGTVTLDFATGSTVEDGPMSLEFSALANIGADALERSDQFLEISDLNMIENPLAQVPEPAPIILVVIGGIAMLARRMRRSK
jgi:hypothetical protein